MRRVLGLAVILVLLASACSSQDDSALTTPSTGTSTSTSVPFTTSTTEAAGATAVWPSSPADAHEADPVEAARSFATEFLGFTDPFVGAFREGDQRSGEIDVRPKADGPATTVLLRKLSDDATWSVLGSATEDIVVSAPAAGEAVSSPMRVQGSALAFEGNVAVEVRRDGAREPIGTGHVTGGGDVMRAFDGTVAFADPNADHGALVLLTRSMEDGRVWTASVVRIGFGNTATPLRCESPPEPAVRADEMAVTVFFTCADGTLENLVSVGRAVSSSPRVLHASLDALVAGPGETGLVSWFSKETASVVRSVDIDGDHAVVDFYDLRTLIPNASTSAGSKLLLDQLDATVFQFPSVASAEYRIDGSCDAFSEWLQLECTPRTPDR